MRLESREHRVQTTAPPSLRPSILPSLLPLSLLPLPTFSPHPSFTSPCHPLPPPLCIPPIPPPSLCLPSPVPPSLPLSPCLRRPTQTSMNNSDCVALQDSPPHPRASRSPCPLPSVCITPPSSLLFCKIRESTLPTQFNYTLGLNKATFVFDVA